MKPVFWFSKGTLARSVSQLGNADASNAGRRQLERQRNPIEPHAHPRDGPQIVRRGRELRRGRAGSLDEQAGCLRIVEIRTAGRQGQGLSVFARGDFIQAEALSSESLLIWRELGDRWDPRLLVEKRDLFDGPLCVR